MVWLLRAKAPSMFIPHMDGFAIVEESDNALTRTLDFGKFKVNDRVDFVPMEKLHFHIPAQGEIMESRLEIAIEEPFPDRFFLRFIYEDSAAEEGPEAMYNDFRRSAYKEMDVDSMRLIRRFAVSVVLTALRQTKKRFYRKYLQNVQRHLVIRRRENGVQFVKNALVQCDIPCLAVFLNAPEA